MKHPSKAFTLIELLTVIAIIGILAAILIPVVGRVRDNARSAKCISNLRGIGSGLYAYEAEHGHLVPSAIVSDSPRIHWFNVLEPYMGDRVTDPSDPDRPDWQLCPAREPHEPNSRAVGYGWNYLGFGQWPVDSNNHNPGESSGHYMRLANVMNPSGTIIIGDSPDRGDFFRWVYIYNALGGGNLARRHREGGHYLFVDGHVEHFTADDLIAELHKDNKAIFRP